MPGSDTGHPYQAILGGRFALLHPHVQRAHVAPLAATGTLDVEHGRYWLAPLLRRAMTLPAAGNRQPVLLDVTTAGTEMRWVRRIAGVELRTRQRAEGPLLVERHGLGRIAFRLDVRDGNLEYRQCGIGFAGIPIPPAVSPLVSARIAPTAEGWHVAVTVTWRGHLVCRYAGNIRPA